VIIENFVGAAESEILEWKSSLSQLNRIIETISAFSNTKGGKPPYKRVGKSTIKMSKDEYERLILEKHRDRLYFDSQICKEATLGDIDKEKIRWFLRKAKVERSLDIDSSASSTEALKRLNLLIDNKPTNTAILMFGKNPQRFFIQSEVRCARFKGIEAVKPFIDMKVINGSIYKQIDQAEKFILFNIKKSAWI